MEMYAGLYRLAVYLKNRAVERTEHTSQQQYNTEK
jgi:hypothetical protein